jgi:CRP-like cAMP-binding protein
MYEQSDVDIGQTGVMSTHVVVDQKALNELLDRLPQVSEAVARDDLAYYLRGIGRMELASGSELFLQGQPVEVIYLLISGAILESRSSDDSDPATQVPLRSVRASDPSRFLGMYDFIYRNPHTTSVVATEPSQVVAIQAVDFGRLLHRFPDLRGQLMQTDLISRLRTMQLLAGANLTAISYLAEMAQVHNL